MNRDKTVGFYEVCQFVKEVVRMVVNKLKKVMQVLEVENTWTTEKLAS